MSLIDKFRDLAKRRSPFDEMTVESNDGARVVALFEAAKKAAEQAARAVAPSSRVPNYDELAAALADMEKP